MQPPPLRNDCFALPQGVDWTPVDEALAHLRAVLHPVKGCEQVPIERASGRFLAANVLAARSSPPTANSAVDGYGFQAASVGNGVCILPLLEGRAAAGAPFDGPVPAGSALRILTGAALPIGVDTVVLEEDVTIESGKIAFQGPLKAGANTREKGEDVLDGGLALSSGTCVGPQELALLAATGAHEVEVHKQLRVGVISTGDELRAIGAEVDSSGIYDANRPMLLSLMERWGLMAVDLGHVPDDSDELRSRLDAAAQCVDVILTSGGASAGDEDHVSAVLAETGAMEIWRIAIKPGRPLALGLWQGVPVFGLPGNPVAAFVCALVFAAPALELLAGGHWRTPAGYSVPAAFSKSKKPGRREYLRARITKDGAAEVFRSEGSGRISGIAWADGLVEIEDDAREIMPGDMVRYIPYSGFALGQGRLADRLG